MSVNIGLISLYGVENNGVRSISSVLKKNGFNTHLIFFKRWVNNDISYPTDREKEALLRLLKELNIGIVGFSFTSPFLKIARGLTQKIKMNSAAKVVWGGIHATVCPDESLKYCDFVCRGEGEEAMLELAQALEKGDFRGGIGNICCGAGSVSVARELRPLIRDLDSLPALDYGNGNKHFIEGKLEHIDPLSYAPELRISASRGCPFDCSYCYNSIMRGLYGAQHYHRIRSPEGIISEISHALAKFPGIRKIKFEDDTFIFPDEWVDRFSKLYKQEVGLPFEVMCKAECMNDRLLKPLYGAGLRKIQVGIQTGSSREANAYNRQLSLEKILTLAARLRELKLGVVYDVILDNPLATAEDKEAIVSFLLRLPRPFDLFLYSLTIFPGTKLYDELLGRGLIRPRDAEGDSEKSFYQFRLSFSYPRSKEELFFACVISLTSKSFIPRALIARILRSSFLKQHPLALKWLAIICNQIKLAGVLLRMLRRKEVNLWKFREYGTPKRFLIQ